MQVGRCVTNFGDVRAVHNRDDLILWQHDGCNPGRTPHSQCSSRTSEIFENRHYRQDGLRTQRMARFRSDDAEDGEQPTVQHALSMVKRRLMSREEPAFTVLKPRD